MTVPPNAARVGGAELPPVLSVDLRSEAGRAAVRAAQAHPAPDATVFLTDAERDAAHAAGAGLGMTQAQVLGVITLTEQAATSE